MASGLALRTSCASFIEATWGRRSCSPSSACCTRSRNVLHAVFRCFSSLCSTLRIVVPFQLQCQLSEADATATSSRWLTSSTPPTVAYHDVTPRFIGRSLSGDRCLAVGSSQPWRQMVSMCSCRWCSFWFMFRGNDGALCIGGPMNHALGVSWGDVHRSCSCVVPLF